MSKLGSKEEILAAIQTHFEHIQSGSLTADGMESLVELTRELHERALILRYKAYEEKVLGVRTVPADPEPEETEAATAETVPAETAAETISQPESEPAQHSLGFEAVEAEILQAEPPIPAEEPVFDFDMFEKAEANIFTPEPVAEEPAVEEPVAETPVSEPAAEAPAPEVISTPSQEAQAIADEIEESPVTVSQQMPIAEENSEPVNIFTPYTPAPNPEPTPEPQAEMPLPEELAIMNEPVIIPEKPQVQQEDNDMFKRFSNNGGSDDSLGSRLMSTKLTTLVGAFGLNEKLQCIRELFKGSSEAFNNAIETLDQQENFAAAKRILAQYAQQNSWNLESNLTAEFIQKVERRYQ